MHNVDIVYDLLAKYGGVHGIAMIPLMMAFDGVLIFC